MRCTECGTRSKRREYISVKRKGGGNYRRPMRWYDSTLCVPCAEDYVEQYLRLTAENRGVGRTTGGTNYSWRSIFRGLGRDDLAEDHLDYQ